MFRSPLFSVLLILALGAGAFRVYQLSSQVSELTAENQDLQARYQNLQSELLQAHAKQETTRMGQESLIDQLQAQIIAQKDELATAEQRLRKERGEAGSGKPLEDLHGKVQQEGQLIADLEQQLKDIHERQTQLRNQDKFYQQQAGANQRQNDADLKAQIAQQAQVLRQLTAQLKRFKVNPWDSDSTDQFNALQAQVQAQKTTIQQLKEQRSSNGAQWGYQKAQSHEQNRQSLTELKSSEEQIQAQLQREKAASASLRRDIQSGVQTRKSQEALVESAQADVESQRAKLQDLQTQLQTAQQQLQRISGK